MTKKVFLIFVALSACSSNLTVPINKISATGVGESIGTITLSQEVLGVRLTPALTSLSPGEHGFHIHQKPSCEPGEKDGVVVAGGAAGPHFDPTGAGKHEGPLGAGHKGDLPKLIVRPDGTIFSSVVAPKLTLDDLKGKSLMIHAGGDNYSDTPKPLGGGGERIACGVVN